MLRARFETLEPIATLDGLLLVSAALILLLLCLSDIMGSWLRRRFGPAAFSETDERHAGLMLTTNFSQLAFLPDFTFNLAMARFETRLGGRWQHTLRYRTGPRMQSCTKNQ